MSKPGSPPGRRLSPAEAEVWARLASTVKPFKRAVVPVVPSAPPTRQAPPPIAAPLAADKRHLAPIASRPAATRPVVPPPRMLDGHTLDAHWDRKLARGQARPDFTLDLHGATLDAAYGRLDHGLTQAAAQGARMVLLITGRPRANVAPADRSSQRGAIRARCLDWLAQGRHASRIAAIRPAHPRHGGAGALYIILRKGG